ncbi:MAG TPA: two-component sensor histidine kinase [Oscillatoriaceae cyanobacterium M33_DOE_052]|uniref:Circadian input-output histidine kinase CikA n=1 Tax=Planktothricoides sp. SpSt-374 TaxID=2282167 RepID=A0A7C3ZTY1_9CYAN|nr:two-component sensor histidine kinase [Oscillatoriaceae cyanobacterium M33_DOE_052]
MVKSGQSSFRRIILFWIVPLSVAGLLLGVVVTYRKARTALLETARQNLTESAIRKGESIELALKALQVNLLTASETAVLQSGTVAEAKQFLEQLQQRLPTRVECAQLTDLETGQIVTSTCGNEKIYTQLPLDLWQKQLTSGSAAKVSVTTILPSSSPSPGGSGVTNKGESGQLKLLLNAPVYGGRGPDFSPGNSGSLRYALSIRSVLEQRSIDDDDDGASQSQDSDMGEKRSLTGKTVVIDASGTILEHPDPMRVGDNLSEEKDAARLQSIMRNAIAGRQDFLHLFNFLDPNVELLSGYTAIPSPLNPEQKWVILAVTRLDYALAGLKEIQGVLIQLIVALFLANLVVAVLIARQLARPIENLQDYALNIQNRPAGERAPLNFNIKEFDGLAEALNIMVERLKAWAQELETAWKEAKTSNQLKNEFLATISHELRTPLNAIIGCIRLVRDDCCDDRAEEVEFLQRADDAAIHLLNIINDILDISKIEAGTLSVVMEPVDIRKIIKEVLDLQESAIQNKGLQLQATEAPEPLMVDADPGKLKQVLLNLVGNAIKFTDTGSISISTRTTSSYPDTKLVASTGKPLAVNGSGVPHTVVVVKDTGIGVAPEQQEKLFQPFVMVDGSTTRRHGGTGLGLAISRNIVELMGGTISLYSQGINQGTTVEIALPTMSFSDSHHPSGGKDGSSMKSISGVSNDE